MRGAPCDDGIGDCTRCAMRATARHDAVAPLTPAALPWIEHQTEAIADQVHCHYGQEEREAGEDHRPRCVADIFTASVQHGTPLRRWRLRTKAEERKRRGEQHCVAEIKCG